MKERVYNALLFDDMFLENGVSFWNPGLAGFLEKLARNLEFNDCVKKTRKERKIIFNVYTIHSSLNDTIILSLHLFILFSN